MGKFSLLIRRIIALIIDSFAIYFIYFSLSILLIQSGYYPQLKVITIGYFAVFMLYFVILEKKYKQTIGKFVTGIKIERENGQLTTFLLLLRTFIFFIESWLLFIPCLTFFFNKKGKTLHDIICKTVVVNTATSQHFDMETINKKKEVKTF